MDVTPATMLTRRYADAVGYACEVHARQVRKGTRVPYVAHLIGVSSLVLEAGADEDLAIAALLHDAAEDHGGEARLADIEGRFGARVAGVVRDCSDSLEPGRRGEGRLGDAQARASRASRGCAGRHPARVDGRQGAQRPRHRHRPGGARVRTSCRASTRHRTGSSGTTRRISPSPSAGRVPDALLVPLRDAVARLRDAARRADGRRLSGTGTGTTRGGRDAARLRR